MSQSKIKYTDDELKQRLSSQEYHVTQEQGTEAAFTGKYHNAKDQGIYQCVVCGSDLFYSTAKFDSGTGWPSFYQPVVNEAIENKEDLSHGMNRVEVVCSKCKAHLGHVFPDGPEPTRQRFCINSAALVLDKK